MTAIVPTWNRRELLEKLILSLSRQTRPPEAIVVVDNGSTDGAAEAAERLGARVLRMGRNAGFAAAVNRGIRESRSALVAVLNNDVQLEPEYLERVAAAASRPGAWFATGKILDARNPVRVDACWDVLALSGCAWRVGQGRADQAAFSSPRGIAFAPATAAVYRRDIFERVGYFDEMFESYLEDVEFGLRCLIAGCAGWYEPAARAYHLGSATLGAWHPETVRRIARNQSWLAARYLGLNWHVVVGQGLWGLLAMRHGRLLPWLTGKWQGLRRRGAAEALRPALRDCEEEILRLQRDTGWDLYWRLYFFLTRGVTG